MEENFLHDMHKLINIMLARFHNYASWNIFSVAFP